VDSRSAVVLVTGLQGSGKSTVGEAIARRLDAPVFAWDWFMAALTPFDGLQVAMNQMDAREYRAIGWALMAHAARQQLRQGSSVVLDGLARDEEIRAVRALAQECDVACVVTLLRCDDAEVQRARIEQRSRPIPGWHELTWDDVARARSRWVEPADVDLALDSTHAVATLVDAVIEKVRRAGGAP